MLVLRLFLDFYEMCLGACAGLIRFGVFNVKVLVCVCYVRGWYLPVGFGWVLGLVFLRRLG